MNAKAVYDVTERTTFRIFAREFKRDEKPYKLPYRLKSIILEEVYWRVVNINSGEVIIPFAKGNNGTRLSCDSQGMSFDMYMDSLPPGQDYTLEFYVVDRGSEIILRAENLRFRVN